jgi:hypothetical protein
MQLLISPAVTLPLLDYDRSVLFKLLSLLAVNLCSSLSVRDQVSHPYKRTGTIVVYYI